MLEQMQNKDVDHTFEQVQTKTVEISPVDIRNLIDTSSSILSCARGLRSALILAKNFHLGTVELSLSEAYHHEAAKSGIFDILTALTDKLCDNGIHLEDELNLLFYDDETEA